MKKALFVLPLVLLSLLAAVWSGWIRIGWSLPVAQSAARHGALMVGSFLSTLIFLERAATFRNRWVLLPFVNGCSGIFFLTGQPAVAQLLLIAGSAGFVALCLYFIYRYREFYYYVSFTGALCLLLGNVLLYRTNFYPLAVPWWMDFLLFTIVAERLELSRFLPLSRNKRGWLIGALAGVLVALCWPFHLQGYWLLAISFAAVALWLLQYDMAWHSVRIPGQHRYSGLLLITGYAWLLVTAALLVSGHSYNFGYDAALHAFFIGFVFSMIFSHAPIILPAILKLPVKPYRPVLYIWFVLLQLSLLVRIGGDVWENVGVRKWAGGISGAAILLFFISVAAILRQELQKSTTKAPRR